MLLICLLGTKRKQAYLGNIKIKTVVRRDDGIKEFGKKRKEKKGNSCTWALRWEQKLQTSLPSQTLSQKQTEKVGVSCIQQEASKEAELVQRI